MKEEVKMQNLYSVKPIEWRSGEFAYVAATDQAEALGKFAKTYPEEEGNLIKCDVKYIGEVVV